MLQHMGSSWRRGRGNGAQRVRCALSDGHTSGGVLPVTIVLLLGIHQISFYNLLKAFDSYALDWCAFLLCCVIACRYVHLRHI